MTDDHVRRLKMLANDVSEMGGEAVILETVALDRAQERKVISRFTADRDGKYREFLGRYADFQKEIAEEIVIKKFIYAELEEEDTDLKKLPGLAEEDPQAQLLRRSTPRRSRSASERLRGAP